MYNADQIVEISGKLANTNGVQHADREDIAQDIALAMLEAGNKADESRNVRAYQYTTAKGIGLNAFKRITKQANRFRTILNVPADAKEDEGEGDNSDLLPDAAPSGIDLALARERSRAITSAIDSLPVMQGNAVREVMQNGTTLEAFGQQNGFTKARAHQILGAAKEALAFKLQEWEGTLA